MVLVNNESCHLIFPSVPVLLNSPLITVSVGQIKSRNPSIVYFLLHCLDKTGSVSNTYTSDRWVIGSEYEFNSYGFELTEDISSIHSLQLEMVLLNISSENPLWFTELMLQNGAFVEYHRPNDVEKEVSIEFESNNYVNLYNMHDDNYLQVIRTKLDKFSNTVLSASQCTVLAPHLANENSFDNPVSLLYEFLNQREQKINIER